MFWKSKFKTTICYLSIENAANNVLKPAANAAKNKETHVRKNVEQGTKSTMSSRTTPRAIHHLQGS